MVILKGTADQEFLGGTAGDDQIDALRQEAVIAERLSALRQGAPSPGPRAKKGKSSR